MPGRRDISPEGHSAHHGTTTRKYGHVKMNQKFKNNLMIDPSATFVAGVGMGIGANERSRSGINGTKMISPLATNGFGHMFNATLQGQGSLHPQTIKNQHLRARANGSNLGGFVSNSGSKGNLHDFHMTSGGNAFQSLPRDAVPNRQKKALKSNASNLKIPTITLHNQSFLKFSPRNDGNQLSVRSNERSPPPSFQRAANQSSSKNLNRTLYQMPQISQAQNSGRDHSDSHRRRLNNQIFQTIQKSNAKLQVIDERRERGSKRHAH